jgi:putative DNA primase/helicase
MPRIRFLKTGGRRQPTPHEYARYLRVAETVFEAPAGWWVRAREQIAALLPRLAGGADKASIKEYASTLEQNDHFATGGSQVWIYRDGYYQRGEAGEAGLPKKVKTLLDHSWSKYLSSSIEAYIRIGAPELWETPPVETINCVNGLLDVRTRKLSPHTPEHLSPVRINAKYDPRTTCPTIERFLDEAIPDLRNLYLEVGGLMMTPDNRYEKAIMAVGAGGTGKTTALELISALVSFENTARVSLHKLEDDRFASADLYGRLVNIVADLPSSQLSGSSTFKAITGKDRIRGERKHRDAFDFTPYARLLFSANEVPPTADHSDAYFERWVILPFPRKFRGVAGCDKNLLAKMTTPTELSGFLNLALDGLARLHKQQGFSVPKTSVEAAERFRIDSDSVAGFVEEQCVTGADEEIRKSELYEEYRAWCERNGRVRLSAQRFNRRLKELCELSEITKTGKDYWIGINKKRAY